jgi:hypothetical protein
VSPASATTASYAPPATCAATFHVTVKATGAGGVSGSTVLSVTPGASGTVSVSPATIALRAGDAPVTLHAVLASGASGDVVWSLTSGAADAGALEGADPSGWCQYRPPASLAAPIDVTVTATVGTIAGHAQLHVAPVAGPSRVVVTPASQAIFAGAAAVQLTATLVAGATGPITWTTNAGAPGTIVADATGATATYTPPASVSGSTPVTLTATPASGASASGVITVLAPTDGQTVSGKVLSKSGRRPVEGAVVQIGAATATTAADGTFTLTGIAVPYTLAVSVSPSPSSATIEVYEGVTTLAPQVPIEVVGSSSSTTVDGALLNGTDGYYPTSVSISGPGVEQQGFSLGLHDYSVDASLTPPVTVTLRALEANASGYGRFGSLALDVASADPVTAATLTYGDPVAFGPVSGTLQPPQGALQTFLLEEARFGAYAAEDVFQFPLASPRGAGTFTTQVPLLPGATSSWLYGASYSSVGTTSLKRKVTPGDTGVSMILPPPPTLTAPADAAQLPASSALVWDGAGASALRVYCHRQGGGWLDITVHTSATSARIPSLQGLEPASGGTCSWTVDLRDDGRPAGAAIDPAAAEPSFAAEATGSSRTVTTP